jgi:glycosyltransferase involved in cell wall biosynthesis
MTAAFRPDRQTGASVGHADRLRILLVNDYGGPSGGAELQMLALRDGLRARGHAVRLLSSDASPGPPVASLADRTCRGRTDRLQAASQAFNPSAWLALRRELAEHPPDVVHLRMFLWQLSPLILQPLASVPVLFQAAVYKAICPNGLKLLPDGSRCTLPAGRACLVKGCVSPATWAATMVQLALVRRWRNRFDRVAALSARMAETFGSCGWPDVLVLGNGVDERPARPPLGPVPVVGYAGRLSREKGIETLLDAFAAAPPDARLVIAGGGPLEAVLRERAARFGERVRFLGHLDRAAMEREFDRVWVQVVPSLWDEPFGNVTTEAMMRGTAVIASDVGGQSDLVRDGRTGALVPPGDAAALGRALARLLSDRTLAEAQGAAARQVALAEYGRERVLDRLEAVYRGMIEARRRAA